MLAGLMRTVLARLMEITLSGLTRTGRFVLELLTTATSTRSQAAGFTLGMAVGVMPKEHPLSILLMVLVILCPCTLWTAIVGAGLFWLVRLAPLTGASMPDCLAVALILAIPTYLLAHWVINMVKRINATGLDARSPRGGSQLGVSHQRFVVTRLLVLLVFLLLLGGLRTSPSPGLDSPTRVAKTNPDNQSHPSLIPSDGLLQLLGLTVTREHSDFSSEALLEATEVDLQFDVEALQGGGYVVTEGEIHGLRLWGPHVENAPSEGPSIPTVDAHAQRRCQQRLDGMRRVLEAPSENPAQMPQRVADGIKRLPAQYAPLEQRVAELAGNLDQVQEFVDEIGDNPLRDVDQYQRAVSELDRLREELNELRFQADGIRRDASHAHRAIVNAAQQQHSLAAAPQFTPLDGDSLSKYLMRPAVAETVRTLLHGVRIGRHWLPPSSSRLRASCNSREVFGGTPATVLFQDVKFNGHAQLGHELIPVDGIVRELHLPTDRSEPAVVRLELGGERSAAVEFVRDTAADKPQEVMDITCSSWPRAAQTVGTNEVLAVAMEAHAARVQLKLTIQGGEAIRGELTIDADDAVFAMSPSADDRSPIDKLLQQTLRQVRGAHSRVVLSGTLNQPQWTVQSTLGEAVAKGLNTRIKQRLDARQREFRAAASEQAKRCGQQLRAAADRAGADVRQKLSESHDRLKELQQALFGQERLRLEMIGRGIQGGSSRR